MPQSTENLTALSNSAQANERLYSDLLSTDSPELWLERFATPQSAVAQQQLELNIETNEFTSLCPITGQPDFATIRILYAPADWCVESKSLKLYFLGFRNHRGFHEQIVNKIRDDLVALLNPVWIRVVGEFTPRGGIKFWPSAYYSRHDQNP